METKKNQSRGRPKKDYWDLKNKIAQKTAENKWKVGRGRPKKEKRIDDSINTKISNHHKDISELEKKNKEIHSKIGKLTEFYESIPNSKKEKYSKILLWFSVAFFICAILFTIICKLIIPSLNKSGNLSFSELENIENENAVNIQIWYNNQNGEFVEMENIDIENNAVEINQEEAIISDEYTNLIISFYDKINNRDFSSLSNMADNYLKKSDSFRTYYSTNRLSKFLDKIAWNRIYVWWFKELPSTKPNVKKYWYVIKYKVDWDNNLTKEDWEMLIVNRDGENLIWSIMCVTTWCSRMPFFQP